MEWIQTVVSNSQQLQETSNMSHCQLFGCSVHGHSFVIQQDASLFSFDMKDLQVKLPEVITQVAVSCQEERGECHYYFKSRTNVYLWILSVE
jgi:hypothetical protein